MLRAGSHDTGHRVATQLGNGCAVNGRVEVDATVKSTAASGIEATIGRIGQPVYGIEDQPLDIVPVVGKTARLMVQIAPVVHYTTMTLVGSTAQR